MKKLRLIKPWDLNTLRQKLNADLCIFAPGTITGITCKGPSDTASVVGVANAARLQPECMFRPQNEVLYGRVLPVYPRNNTI